MLIQGFIPPRTQRSFANDWVELDYLCKKIRYWLYKKRSRNKARRFLDRLNQVLQKLPQNRTAILREEGLAIVFELNGEIGKAITHRKREIELMQRLHKEAQSQPYSDSTKAYMLLDRDIAELEERQAILEALEREKITNNVSFKVTR